MFDMKDMYEAKAQRVEMSQAQRNLSITLAGNKAYDKVLGFNVSIENPDGSEFNGDVTISVREQGGGNRTLMAPIPYRLLKASPLVKFEDRFISLSDVKGKECDLVFNIDATRINAAIVVTAIAAYSKNK